MRRIFRDEHLQSDFTRLGYLHLPLLDPTEVADLNAFYEKQHLTPQGDYGFHISLDHHDPEKVQSIEEKITNVIWPKTQALFDQGKVFTASYVVKEPGLQNIVPPHQDWTFVDESKFCSFTLWVALQDVDIDNGALCILPGSINFFDYHRASPSPQSRSPLTDHYFNIFPYMELIEMKAGEVLIFDNRLIHASPPNTSDKPRIAAGIGVTHAEAQLIHYYQIPGSDPEELEGFEVDKQFFNKFNNVILSGLYEAGERPDGYKSFDIRQRNAPQLSKSEMEALILGVEGNKKNESLIIKLASMYDYNEDGSKKEQEASESTSEDSPVTNQPEEEDQWANRTFWQTYTPKNIIAEIAYRLRGRKEK